MAKIENRKLICGVATNDIPWKDVKKDADTFRVYNSWYHMIRRCYCDGNEKVEGLTVNKRWHKFSNYFKDVQEYELFPMWLENARQYNLVRKKGKTEYSKANCQIIKPQIMEGKCRDMSEEDYNTHFKYLTMLATKHLSWFDMEELQSIALLSLTKAWKTWEDGKGTKFRTWLTEVFINDVTRAKNVLSNRTKHEGYSLDFVVNESNNGSTLTVEDVTPDPSCFAKDIEHREHIKVVKEYIDTLPKDNKKILLMRIGGHSQQKIADTMGIKRSTLARRESVMRENLEEWLVYKQLKEVEVYE